jgi:hypothetical protein
MVTKNLPLDSQITFSLLFELLIKFAILKKKDGDKTNKEIV